MPNALRTGDNGRMNEHTWTAPAAGRYHVVTGQPPHLLYAECTAECGTLADDGSPNPASVEFDASTWQTVAPRTWTRLEGDPEAEIYHEEPGILRIMTRRTADSYGWKPAAPPSAPVTELCLHPLSGPPGPRRAGEPQWRVLCAKPPHGPDVQHQYATFPALPTIPGEIVPPALGDGES